MSRRKTEELCSLGRTLEVVGERWTFWILREALAGSSRFAEFRDHLGIASDVLTVRLTGLVEAGILTRRTYQEPGQRARESYHLTQAGGELSLVLGALQQWGDRHLPCAVGPTTRFSDAEGRPVSVAFLDGEAEQVEVDKVRVIRRPGY